MVNLQFFPLVDRAMLETILAELPDIYSDMNLLIRKKDFITVPENFHDTNDNNLFKLSYNQRAEDKLWTDKSDQGIEIVYAVEIGLVDCICTKFPRIRIRNEVSVILSKLFKEVNFKRPHILISVNDWHLIIYAINEGKLQLCNAFQAKSYDDIFYFVMLTVEQLHFLPGETDLIILGEPPARNDIFELFSNYIKEINIWLEEYKTDDEIKNEHLLSHSFALQTLVCE